jgi:hypothetical protein
MQSKFTDVSEKCTTPISLLPSCWLAWPTLRPWRWRLHVSPNVVKRLPEYTASFPENSNLYSHRYQNLKSNRVCIYNEDLTAVVMKTIIFWDITPCSSLSVNRCFGGTYRPHLQSRKNKLNKTLKMEAICSSQTSFDTQRTTGRYIPEDGTLQSLYLSLVTLTTASLV